MATLKDILNKKREQEERSSRPKVEYFSLKEKNPVFVQFLQELGEDSPKYDSNLGAAVFLTEHVSPYDFRKKAICTYDAEGRCFACEMNQKETQVTVDGITKNYPWSQKTNMYIYLVTDSGDLKVLARPAPGSVFDQLYDFAEEENEGVLTGQTFKISKGPNKNDKWEVKTTKKEVEFPSFSELPDLEAAVSFKVKYENQKDFYGVAVEDGSEEKPVETKAKDELDW